MFHKRITALFKMAKVIIDNPVNLISIKPGIENFGILINNQSLEKLPKVAKNFNDCFIINNFDTEFDIIGNHLLGKNIIQFSNRMYGTTPLNPAHYKNYGIKEIQFYKYNSLLDYRLLYLLYKYQLLGLSTVFLPKYIDVSGLIFGPSFKNKFPSTDLCAIYYALEIIRPKNLWIIGLDFYEHGYLTRNVDNALVERKRKKLKKANAHNVVNEWIRYYKDVNFNIVTYYKGFKHRNNLNIF